MEEVSFVSKLCMYICAQLLSSVWLFSTPWAVACQAPLSMGYSRQEYWSGLPFPSPGDLPDPFPHPSLHINVCSFDFSSEYLSGSLLLNQIKKSLYLYESHNFTPFWKLSLFMAMLGFHCFCAGFLYLWRVGLLFVMVHRLLIAMASLVEEHGL